MRTTRALGAIAIAAATAALLPAAASATATCSVSSHKIVVELPDYQDSVTLSTTSTAIRVHTYPAGAAVACGASTGLTAIDSIDVNATAPSPSRNIVQIVAPASFEPGFSNTGEGAGKSEIEIALGLGSSPTVDDTVELIGTSGNDEYRIGQGGINANMPEGNPAGGAGADADITGVGPIAVAHGGDGNDTLTGTGGFGTGAAASFYLTLDGGAGDDTLAGSAFSDTLTPGSGDDQVAGMGSADDDLVDFGDATAGVTVDLNNGAPQDTGQGVDTIDGVEGAKGSPFADLLVGNGSPGFFDGRDGNDTIEGGGGDNTLRGGLGTDVVSYEHAPAGVQVSLLVSGFTQQNTGGGGKDFVGDDFESLRGSVHADELTGDEQSNSIEGLGGQDTIDAQDGDDAVLARDGEPDSIRCRDGADSVTSDLPGVDFIYPDCEQVLFAQPPEPAPAPPAPPGGGGPSVGSEPDVTAAVASALKVSPSAFRAAPSGPSTSRAKVGGKVTYRLSEAASLKFTVEQATAGRRSGRRCVKQTSRNRKARRCTRYTVVRGSFTDSGAAGANAFTFRGRLGSRKLKQGSYRLVGVPTDAAGNKGKTVRAAFRIVR